MMRRRFPRSDCRCSRDYPPRSSWVAMLWNRDDLGMSLRYEASAQAAQSLGVAVQPLGVREPDDFIGVFEAMDRDPPDAILMVSDLLTTLNRKRVFDYAATHRLPAIYEYDPLVRDGGLMSYGPDLKELCSAPLYGRPHLQRRQTLRIAVRTTNALPVCGQPQDGKGDCSGISAGADRSC